MILLKGHTWFSLRPKTALVIAIACPLSYGITDWIRKAHFNWIACLGLISVLIKGSVGLFEGSNHLLAINEMMLPLLLGILLIGFRLYQKPPFLQKILLNEQFCEVSTIQKALQEKHAEQRLYKRLVRYEWILAAIFLCSAALNYGLARLFVVHPAGTEEFNHELGILTGWSFVVIALPATVGLLVILWRFFYYLKHLSGLSWKQILKN